VTHCTLLAAIIYALKADYPNTRDALEGIASMLRTVHDKGIAIHVELSCIIENKPVKTPEVVGEVNLGDGVHAKILSSLPGQTFTHFYAEGRRTS